MPRALRPVALLLFLLAGLPGCCPASASQVGTWLRKELGRETGREPAFELVCESAASESAALNTS